MNKQQLETRLDFIESQIAKCRDSKSLPALNATFEKLMDRLVALDLAGKESEESL
jgi:hypothetical protein